MNAGRFARWVPVLWTLLLTAGALDAGASQLPADASALPIPAQMAPGETEWESLLAASLREHGAEREQAAQLATLIVAAVEGTVAMCRAKRSTQPLDDTAEQLQALILATIKD